MHAYPNKSVKLAPINSMQAFVMHVKIMPAVFSCLKGVSGWGWRIFQKRF